MAKDPYAYAPEAGEDDRGTVKLADEYNVWHTFTPDQARNFAHQLQVAAEAAERD